MAVIITITLIFYSIVIHEMAHGIAALWLGDRTAKEMGRISLNPLRHIDPFGSIFLPIMLVLLRSPVLFGWAKPVIVNPLRFKNINRKLGMGICAFAGPFSNLLLAFVLCRLLPFAHLDKVLYEGAEPFYYAAMGITPVMQVVYTVAFFNVFLAMFNLLPIPPLDGAKVVGAFLPDDLYISYMSMERYGIIILLMIMWAGGLPFLLPITIKVFMFICGL